MDLNCVIASDGIVKAPDGISCLNYLSLHVCHLTLILETLDFVWIHVGVDSFYEYLFKAHILFGKEDFWRMFHSAYLAVQKYFRHGPWYCTERSSKASHLCLGSFLTTFFSLVLVSFLFFSLLLVRLGLVGGRGFYPLGVDGILEEAHPSISNLGLWLNQDFLGCTL
jgi:hypothetical protein